MKDIFEYVNTTKDLDYAKYLLYAGLKIEKQNVTVTGKADQLKFKITRIDNPSLLQEAILKSWLAGPSLHL